jgi:hypothetical protein
MVRFYFDDARPCSRLRPQQWEPTCRAGRPQQSLRDRREWSERSCSSCQVSGHGERAEQGIRDCGAPNEKCTTPGTGLKGIRGRPRRTNPRNTVLGFECSRFQRHCRGVEGAEYSDGEPPAIREQLARRFHGRLGAGRGGRIIGSGHIGRALASIRRCDAAQDTR